MSILKKINWKVRFMNKAWVISFVAGLLVLAQAVLKLFGIEFDYTGIQGDITQLIEAIFGVLILLGITMDGTTPGVHDTVRAMGYTIPGGYDEDDVEEFTGNRGSV